MLGEIRGIALSDGVVVATESAPNVFSVLDPTGWNGSQTVVSYDVSDQTSDARYAIWCLKRVADDYLQIGCDIRTTPTNVTITAGMPLSAGTYILIGIGGGF